jgi:hypothetical protein
LLGGGLLELVVKRSIIYILATIMLFNLIIPMTSQKASGPTLLPIATIALLQPAQVADVSPNGTGIVEFDGEVTCECATGTTAIVSLSTTDTWNSATVNPSALQFSSNDPGPKNFTVSVKAPLGTSANSVGYVVVTGRVVMYPSTLVGTVQPRDGVTGRIDIAPFYDFQLIANNKDEYTNLGSMVKYYFDIHNFGNSHDYFSICTSGCEKLINDGFQIIFSSETIDVYELETETVEIEVSIPKLKSYDDRIVKIGIDVTSMGCLETNVSACKSIIFTLNLRSDQGTNSNDNILDKQEPDDTKKGFLPGFETFGTIICILISIIILRKSNLHWKN